MKPLACMTDAERYLYFRWREMPPNTYSIRIARPSTPAAVAEWIAYYAALGYLRSIPKQEVAP